jgi:hypothetical protein
MESVRNFLQLLSEDLYRVEEKKEAKCVFNLRRHEWVGGDEICFVVALSQERKMMAIMDLGCEF